MRNISKAEGLGACCNHSLTDPLKAPHKLIGFRQKRPLQTTHDFKGMGRLVSDHEGCQEDLDVVIEMRRLERTAVTKVAEVHNATKKALGHLDDMGLSDKNHNSIVGKGLVKEYRRSCSSHLVDYVLRATLEHLHLQAWVALSQDKRFALCYKNNILQYFSLCYKTTCFQKRQMRFAATTASNLPAAA